MEYNNIVNYFNNIVKQFPPFKDYKVYNILVDFICNNFLKNIYDTQYIKLFKNLFEDDKIEPYLYDNLLYNIGISKDVLDNINESDKYSILLNYPDIYKDKGSVYNINRILDIFNSDINIYELYLYYSIPKLKTLDKYENLKIYQPINSKNGDNLYSKNNNIIYSRNNFNYITKLISKEVYDINDMFIVKGKKLYTNEYITLKYKDIYDKIFDLLITSNQIDNLRNQNLTIFPIKLNTILIDNSINYNIDIINTIYFNHLYDNTTNSYNIYFLNNIQYNLTFSEIILIYLYALSLKYNIIFNKQYNIRILNSYTDELIDKYNNIIYLSDAVKFENYCNLNIITINSTITINDYINKINQNIKLYIDNRKDDINNIIKEIKNSLDSNDINIEIICPYTNIDLLPETKLIKDVLPLHVTYICRNIVNINIDDNVDTCCLEDCVL